MVLLNAYLLLGAALPIAIASQPPIVQSDAGVFHGRYLPEFEQDLYLGIKFAPKPVRFAPATLIENTPNKHFNVSQYGLDCTGYGSDTNTLVAGGYTKMGEDCLHLNIVKPRTEEQGLPVLLWIYGGGWQQGATSDPRYNMSYIVAQSVLNNKPVIGISLNYRNAAFGFIYSNEPYVSRVEMTCCDHLNEASNNMIRILMTTWTKI